MFELGAYTFSTHFPYTHNVCGEKCAHIFDKYTATGGRERERESDTESKEWKRE